MKYIIAVIDNNDVVLDTWLYSNKAEAQYKLQDDFLTMTHLMESMITEHVITNDYAKMVFCDGNFIEWFIMEADNKK